MAEGARDRGRMEGLERGRDADGVDSTVTVNVTSPGWDLVLAALNEPGTCESAVGLEAS